MEKENKKKFSDTFVGKTLKVAALVGLGYAANSDKGREITSAGWKAIKGVFKKEASTEA